MWYFADKTTSIRFKASLPERKDRNEERGREKAPSLPWQGGERRLCCEERKRSFYIEPDTHNEWERKKRNGRTSWKKRTQFSRYIADKIKKRLPASPLMECTYTCYTDLLLGRKAWEKTTIQKRKRREKEEASKTSKKRKVLLSKNSLFP